MTTNGTLDLLATAEAAASRLGDGAAPRFAELRAFLAGPMVVTVVGVPHPERESLRSALAAAMPGATIATTDPLPVVSGQLWDALVLITPADRALSRAELDLVRVAAEQHRPVVVVLSRIGALGSDPAEAVAEVERFRLRPALGLLGVRWHVNATDPGTYAAVVADLDLRRHMTAGHEPAGRIALRAVVDTVITGLADLRDARENAVRLLTDLEGYLPAQITHAHELARLSALDVADRLRGAEDTFHESAFEAASAALDWAANGAVAPWTDIERPVRHAWQELIDRTRGLLPERAEALHASLTGLLENIFTMARPLEVETAVRPGPAPDWATAATRETIDLLYAADIEPALRRFEEAARKALPQEEDEPDDRPDDAVSDDETGDGRLASAVRRTYELGLKVGREIDRRTTMTPTSESLRLGLHTDLRALTARRITDAHAAIREAATAGATAAGDRADRDLRNLLGQISEQVAVRHSWHGAYAELLAVRTKI